MKTLLTILFTAITFVTAYAQEKEDYNLYVLERIIEDKDYNVTNDGHWSWRYRDWSWIDLTQLEGAEAVSSWLGGQTVKFNTQQERVDILGNTNLYEIMVWIHFCSQNQFESVFVSGERISPLWSVFNFHKFHRDMVL